LRKTGRRSSWSASNATDASLDQGISTVAPSGFTTITAAASRTYTLAADAAGAVVTKSRP
jgi:hypothetical protein